MIETTPSLLSALRLWDDRAQARSGAENMAVDESLLAESERTGLSVLRVYRWNRPTLSFGYFLTERVALAARRPGEAMVRRWTGGGVVHHETAVTWSLAVPATEDFFRMRPAASYVGLHEALARCLMATGMSGISIVPATMTALAGGLCAKTPSPGDLLWQGRKIAGAGQRRTRQGLLHQGVIFRPESALTANFPHQMAAVLSETLSDFLPPVDLLSHTARYLDPAWNARR